MGIAAGAGLRVGLGRAAGGSGDAFRLFIGHAGWSEGQLENELKSGAWFVMPATPDHVFGKDENLWVTAIRQIGRSVIHSALKIKHVPEDPLAN
jgi:putative transcriptional regulator